jgi:hypothetical protein
MEFTTCFGLHSQTTRLFDSASWSEQTETDGALTLSSVPFQGTWASSAAEGASLDYNSDGTYVRQIYKLGLSRFTRRY